MLVNNNIHSTGGEAILESLKSNTTLTQIHIGKNDIKPEICEKFAQFYEKKNQIATLKESLQKLENEKNEANSYLKSVKSSKVQKKHIFCF